MNFVSNPKGTMTEEELISAYLDGRLSEAERAAFDARLAQDATMRRRVAATHLLIREARALKAVAPPRNFILPLDADRRQAMPEPRRVSLWIFRLGSLAAAAVFVSLVALESSRPAPFAAAPASVPAAAPVMPAMPEVAQPAAAPLATLPAARAPMGAAKAQEMQTESLPPDSFAASAPAASPTPEVGQEATDAVQPTVPVPPSSSAGEVFGPITLERALAAVALLAAIVLGVLGWARR